MTIQDFKFVIITIDKLEHKYPQFIKHYYSNLWFHRIYFNSKSCQPTSLTISLIEP